jgi:hypothetical protein
LGAEPAGDFPEDHAGPQGTLAIVVGGRDIAAGDEDKEIAAAFTDTAGELAAGRSGRVDSEKLVELAVEVGTVLGEGAVLELWAPLVDGGGAARRGAARRGAARKPGAKPVSPASRGDAIKRAG